MTHHTTTPAQHLAYLTAQTRMPAASVIALRVAVAVSIWATRRRTRMALKQLSDDQLRDVGLTPGEALTESRRVFWRV